ncbi:MAG: ribbon-helix-helix domain-containing protein [Candidatus Methanoplasma sp.]|jgi:Arc/MetJ-type ribon-helix-helix transcriptional regulator|nr:ribbon-helix-helix domain-containing protein [Candidatus Methanoplasma sp.]
MTDDGIKITIRMGSEELQLMENFMSEKDIDNRSDFVRDAIKRYIVSERNGASGAGAEGGLFVRLTEVQLGALDNLVEDGICLSAEEYARKCVVDKIMPVEAEKDAIARAFGASHRASQLK